MTPNTPRRRVANPPTPAAGAHDATDAPRDRYSYRGRPMPDNEARQLPDQLIVHDNAAGDTDNRDALMPGLVARRRTERFVPVPRTPADNVSKEKTA